MLNVQYSPIHHMTIIIAIFPPFDHKEITRILVIHFVLDNYLYS